MRTMIALMVVAAVLVSPCAWDTDPRELIGVADGLAKNHLSPPDAAIVSRLRQK